jgi:hypothetical protein
MPPLAMAKPHGSGLLSSKLAPCTPAAPSSPCSPAQPMPLLSKCPCSPSPGVHDPTSWGSSPPCDSRSQEQGSARYRPHSRRHAPDARDSIKNLDRGGSLPSAPRGSGFSVLSRRRARMSAAVDGDAVPRASGWPRSLPSTRGPSPAELDRPGPACAAGWEVGEAKGAHGGGASL